MGENVKKFEKQFAIILVPSIVSWLIPDHLLIC